MRFVLAFLFLLLNFAGAAHALAQGAAISGSVVDSTGRPIAGVDVVLRDANRAARTDDQGRYTLDDVAPGAYTVWFRRLGYRSIEYNWAAKAGGRTEANIVFFPLPRQLDPVVVRADEDKRAAGRASILGLVMDQQGLPVPEAEVQLVGANMGGTTRDNGGFLFKPLAVGTYLIRVRKLGYTPAMQSVQLVQGDDREIVFVLRSLAKKLDAFQVTERSGYGRDQSVYEELEQRKRWINFQNRLIGPEDLKTYYGRHLDEALIKLGLYQSKTIVGAKAARPMNPGTTNPYKTAGMGDVLHDNVCLLLNGKEGVWQPLATYSTDDLEMLEVYPPGTELTGSVSWRFHMGQCKAISFVDHPLYLVLWFKNR